MVQNQARNNLSRWLHRTGLLVASAVFLLLLASLLSQQLATIPVQGDLSQASTGKVSVMQTATPLNAPEEEAPALVPLPLTNTLMITPTLAPLRSTTQSTSSVTLTTNPVTANFVTSTLSTSVSSESIALVGVDGALLVGATDQPLQPLPLGTLLTINGRTADSTWLYVTTSDKEMGWVESKQVTAFNLPVLPVLEKSINLTATMSVTNPVQAEEPPALALNSATAALPDAGTTITASPTPASSPAPDGRPTVRIILQRSRLNVRSGPGTEHPILAKALYNQSFPALARNHAATWVQIELPKAQGGFGWVSIEFVNLSEPVANLPVSDQINGAPLPTPPPQPAPAASSNPPTAVPTIVAAISQPAAQQTGPASPPSGQPTGLPGKLVIQSQLGGAFYLYDLATGVARTLTSGMDPAISPDGRQIAFARGGSANGIYLINSDGSNERKIFGERSGLRSPKWSPDGKWLVFSRADGSYQCRDIGNGGLCPSDSQLVAGLTDNLPPEQQKEANRQIVSQFDEVSKPNWMIARISATGADYRDLPALNSALAPDWATGGIVYQSSDGLQRTDDRPDAQTQRIYADYNIQDPDWQPGSGRIVFQIKQGPHWEIFTVDPDGKGVTALTRPATTLVEQLPSNVAPAWSPEGQYIVFLSNREQNGEAGQWRIWVMNADGSNQHPLPIALSLTYTFALEQMVDWGA